MAMLQPVTIPAGLTDRLMDMTEVEHVTTYSAVTIRRKVAAGEFPRPLA